MKEIYHDPKSRVDLRFERVKDTEVVAENGDVFFIVRLLEPFRKKYCVGQEVADKSLVLHIDLLYAELYMAEGWKTHLVNKCSKNYTMDFGY